MWESDVQPANQPTPLTDLVGNAEVFNTSAGSSPLGLDTPWSGTVSTVPPGSTSPPDQVTAQAGIPSYAPSSVDLFLRCPMLWWLTKRGWRPQVEPEWTPNRLVGAAVGAGLAEVYRHYDPMGDALQGLSSALQVAYRALEGEWVEQETWTIPTLQKLVERGVRLALEGPQLQGMASVVLNEPHGLYGRRPDVVFRRMGDNRLVVDDDKVIMSLDARYEASRLAEYDHAWQIKDYAYHVGEYLAEPVAEGRYYLIVLGPRKHTTLHKVDVSPESLKRWYASATSIWQTMDAVERGVQEPWQNLLVCTSKSTHYGHRCPMYDACHVYHGDERAMLTLYERELTLVGEAR